MQSTIRKALVSSSNTLTNGALKLVITLFMGSLLIPLLVFAAGYGALSKEVEKNKEIYATKVEVEQLRGDIKLVRLYLENSPWITPEIEKKADVLQRQIDERNRQLSFGYSGPGEKNTTAGQP